MCSDVANLQEYNNYTIMSVELRNSIGSGPSSLFSDDIRTLQAGKYFIEALSTYTRLRYMVSHMFQGYFA